MSQKQEINRFSEESQKIHGDMNQTEIFELVRDFCKQTMSSEFGIICCSCGRKLKYMRSLTIATLLHAGSLYRDLRT